MRNNAIIIIAFLGMSLMCVAQGLESQEDGLKVDVTALDSTVCSHEPVRFVMTLSNRGYTPIAANLGRNSEEYISIGLQQIGGQWKMMSAPSRGGFASLGIVSLNPGQEKSIFFMVDRWVGKLPKGKYRLRVTLNVPNTTREWDPPSGVTLSGKLKQDSLFNLEVDKSCPAKLAELAERDLTIIFASDTIEHKQQASRHLSYIDDPVAVPYLERAVVQDGISNHEIMDGLARIDDITAVEAVIQLSNERDPDISSYAKSVLGRMLQSEHDPTVRSVIQNAMQK